MGRRQAAGGDRLGRTVALSDLDNGLVIVEELVKLLLELNGEAVAAGEDSLEAAKVGLLHTGKAKKSLIKRGNAGDKVAAVLGDKLGVACGGKSRNENAAAAVCEHRMDADAEAEAVEKGHGGEHLIARAEHLVDADDLSGEGVEIKVSKHYTLRGAGSAAGIQNNGGILRAALYGIVPEAGVAKLQEVSPADNRSVLRDLLHLAALGKHISCLYHRGKLILNAGEDYIDDLSVLPYGLDLSVKLVEGYNGDAS